MPSSNHLEPDRLILIGASTGGPGHIRKIVQSLSSDFNASIVIAQHMADEFIPSFVAQLQKISQLQVRAVTDKSELNSGHIYICSLVTRLQTFNKKIQFSQKLSEISSYNPEIDQLFESAVILSQKCSILAVILTGVGDDGARGCKLLFEAGAKCIAESESSAIVFGMPMQAQLMTKDITVKSLDQITKAIKLFGA